MNLLLTHRVAATQARIKLLDAVSHVLPDLSDIHALEQLKADVADYVVQKAASGELPADPLEHVIDELMAIEVTLVGISDFAGRCSALGQHLDNPGKGSLSAADLASTQHAVAAAEGALSSSLDQFRRRLVPDQWSNEHDLTADLREVAEAMMPQSTLLKLPRRDLYLLAHESDPLIETIRERFRQSADAKQPGRRQPPGSRGS